MLGGNPLMALGDPARAIPAFEELELLVSIDARLNETGRYAHYVIATTQPFERHDVTVPGDGAYPEPFAQYAPPAIPKPQGLIDDWEFYHDVAARMGMPLQFKLWNYGMEFDSIERSLPLDGTRKPSGEELVAFLCGEGDVTFEELAASPGGVRPQRPPQYVQPAPDNGARLELCPPDVAAELDKVLHEQPDAAFQYRLTCRRTLEALNCAYRESRGARRKYPVNWAHLNPDDMAEGGIAEGATIEIQSESGSIRAVAKGESRLRRGVVSMSHLFGALEPSDDPRADGGSYTGRLTSLERHLEPINFMPRFSAIPVNVRPLP